MYNTHINYEPQEGLINKYEGLSAYELLKQILLEEEENQRIDFLTNLICRLADDNVIDVYWIEIY